MPVEKDMALTPDKKKELAKELQLEINAINEAIRTGGATGAVLETVRQNREKLQGLVNKILSKKGVVTPQETNDALDAVEKSKRQRLASGYSLTLRKVAIAATVLIIAAWAFYYIKKVKSSQ